MGVLAVTRALGDLALQNYGLTARPDTCHFQRTEADHFLILATDGLWDVLSSQVGAGGRVGPLAAWLAVTAASPRASWAAR